MIRWIVAVIATEALVEILIHSELFTWLRKFLPRLASCGWCLSVWVGAGAFALIIFGLWWTMIPLVIARMSNLFHEILTRVRG